MHVPPEDLEQQLDIGESLTTSPAGGLETTFHRESEDQFLVSVAETDTGREVLWQRITITNRNPYHLSAELENIDDDFWDIEKDGAPVVLPDLIGQTIEGKFHFNYAERKLEITTE